MNVEQIFAHLQETKLINILSLKDKLIFIGDELTLSYLKNKINLLNPISHHHYYCWSTANNQSKLCNLLGSLNRLAQYTVIIASVSNEHIIAEQVKEYIVSKKINIKILKLFSDFLVNILSNKKKLLQTSEIQFSVPSLSYSIITAPRSGSTFLCNLLKSTDLAGFPAENLRNPPAVLARNCYFDYIRYMKILMTCKTTSNGVFGTKIISHFLSTYRRRDLNIDAFLKQYFSKYIYIIREDKVAQAVSVFIAQTTKIWHIANQKQQQKYNQKIKEINLDDIDLKEIKKKYDFLCRQEKYLESFFRYNQIDPLVVKYEELVKNPDQYISNILMYLGINSQKIDLNIQTNLRKTKSSLSSQIIQKFKENYYIS